MPVKTVHIISMGSGSESDISYNASKLIRASDQVFCQDNIFPELFAELNIQTELIDSGSANDIALKILQSGSEAISYCVCNISIKEHEIKQAIAILSNDKAHAILHSLPGESDFDMLIQVFAQLRSENGCPWDKAQTHESLKKYLLEECYEAVEAIDSNDPKLLLDELGDVLLQIMLHCQIAKEEGSFGAYDVVNHLSEKIIRRHPHVFSQMEINDLEAAWDSIKSEEKSYATESEKLSSVAKSLPSAMYAQKIQKRAAAAGIDFSNALEALDRLNNDTERLNKSIGENDIEAQEIGISDILFTCVCIARHLGYDAESALMSAANRFAHHFSEMERIITNENKKFSDLSSKESKLYWEMSKNNIKSQKTY